jgi:hypothetical protein
MKKEILYLIEDFESGYITAYELTEKIKNIINLK